jgi:hypothetical protein
VVDCQSLWPRLFRWGRCVGCVQSAGPGARSALCSAGCSPVVFCSPVPVPVPVPCSREPACLPLHRARLLAVLWKHTVTTGRRSSTSLPARRPRIHPRSPIRCAPDGAGSAARCRQCLVCSKFQKFYKILRHIESFEYMHGVLNVGKK